MKHVPSAMKSSLFAAGFAAIGLLCACSRIPDAPPSVRSTEVVPATRNCAALQQLDLTLIGGVGSRVVLATEGTSGGVPVCTVEAALAPSIGIRLVLPTRTWTQRYLQVGCGGLCGRISMEVGAAEGCMPLQTGGFALASTDMGHRADDTSWGKDAQKRADFAHRAQHLTAVAGKALVQAFYGRAPSYAYFTGCSDGGREGLVAAQRYPADFDGVIAGAPPLNLQVQNAIYHAWQASANRTADGAPILLAGRLDLLHRAVLDACDALDGRVDKLVSAPLACRFDPGTIQCPTAGATAACLTAGEVQAVRRLYDGPRDPATNQRLTAGGPQPGSELAWAGLWVPASDSAPLFSERIALEYLRDLAFESPLPATFRLADIRFDRATFDQLRPRHRLFDATNPDLSRFADAGGKLILWHGWADGDISPINTIAYHEAMRATMGPARVDGFERLYLFPGMHHCHGGAGPSVVDLLTPMLAWVEQGKSPSAVEVGQPAASRATAFGAREQPAAASAGGPRPIPAHLRSPATTLHVEPFRNDGWTPPSWAGSDFFQAYVPREK